VDVEYPLGHRRRRSEGLPLLVQKFRDNVATRFAAARVQPLVDLFEDAKRLEGLRVPTFMELWAREV
jgi:2-methylcitrate dehydratase PrpD